MRIVCISDTHGLHDRLAVPEGDILVHAGDLSVRGERNEIESFDRWLGTLPHAHKVLIAGNHDFAFQDEPAARSWITNALYLQDEEATVAGLRFYGSPWQPRFFDWAFNLSRGAELRAVWDKIPSGIDVLVTHGPPAGVLDQTDDGRRVGCADLLEAVQRVAPRLHVFGHIHEAHGERAEGRTLFVNACSCDLRYRPVQPPIVVELA
jgi:predicted phosphodiesterase